MLRAQQLEYEFTEESLAAALACLKQALMIDPSYPPAMALAAYCYVGRRIQGWTKDFSAETAEGLRLASRAVELGKDDGNVLWRPRTVSGNWGGTCNAPMNSPIVRCG
jgi:hypothetical protein